MKSRNVPDTERPRGLSALVAVTSKPTGIDLGGPGGEFDANGVFVGGGVLTDTKETIGIEVSGSPVASEGYGMLVVANFTFVQQHGNVFEDVKRAGEALSFVLKGIEKLVDSVRDPLPWIDDLEGGREQYPDSVKDVVRCHWY